MAGNVPNTFGLRCASYSLFYADANLNSSAFLGCCEINPKSTPDWLCPEVNIRQMTYDKDSPKIPIQMCLDPTAQWYSCLFTRTRAPFLGCCDKDPCIVGYCPQFKGARLAENRDTAKSFLDRATSIVRDPSVTTKATTSTSGTQAASSSALTATTTASPSPSAPAEVGGGGGGSGGGGGIQPGVAAGIAVGAAAVAAGVAALIFWMVRRRKRSAGVGAAHHHHHHQPGDDPAVSEAPFSPSSQATAASATAAASAAAASPKGGLWRSSVWSRNSAVVSPSQHTQTPPPPPPPPSGPCSPVYQEAVTQEATGPVELPTSSACFELPAEVSPRPTPTPGH